MVSHLRTDLRSTWPRLEGVDLLRGLAILFVLMNHVNMQLLFASVPYTKGLPRQLVASLVWNGQFGVQIFFAVSGFLITSTTIQRWKSLQNVSPREFYWLRFARIAPLLLLLLTILSLLHWAQVKRFVVGTQTGGLGSALLAALTFRINVLEARHGYLPGSWDILWSLSVEETFYLIFPLACRLLKRGYLLIAALLIFVVLGPLGRTLFAHGNPVWKEYSYLGAMDAIALGCLTAILVAHNRLPQRVLWIFGIVGSALVVFILGFSLRAEAWGLERSGLDMTILALGTCMLIAVAAKTQWRAPRAFSPVLWLGQRSYEIYLTHMFIVVLAFSLFVRLGKPRGAVALLFAIVVVLSGVVGGAVARLYSAPVNRVLRQRFGTGPNRLRSVVDNPGSV